MTSARKLTRAGLITVLRNRLSLSARDASGILESLINIVIENIVEKKSVTIKGLGHFEVKKTPSRPARNPRTGGYAMVEERLRPSFNMSRHLRDKMFRRAEIEGPLADGYADPDEEDAEDEAPDAEDAYPESPV
ncbi:MAG: HU family DNA-binding protein [Deltaproteobacteria bacterium]|jgi:nucleoid DNA-binding protein|nr:HU family DNA-binding protein [Deltaproteobacteria bacterium]